MEYKDYYNILGVDKKATQNEIKKAFRALAVKHHPDKNPDNKDSEEKFKVVNEANEVLSNPGKRKQYDELGANWKHYGQAANQAENNPYGRASNGQYRDGGNSSFGNSGGEDFSDFFEQFFAGKASGGRRSQERKGGDYETEMEISLEEAYQGTSRIIQLENEKLRITTKPGAYTGQRLRIKGKGAKGSSEQHHGDLFVRILVKPNSQFTCKGNDLYITNTVDLYTAILGGDTIVKTLSGQVKVKIAEGTQSGKTIRLKGKGMPVYEKPDTFGDLYVQIHVQIPDKLTDKQRTIFEQLKSDVQ